MSQITKLQIDPQFDLEEFMNISQESRISEEALEAIFELWHKWKTKLNSIQIEANDGSWAAIWLPEEIEQEVDEIWAKSPGEGYFINSLAQYLCMAAINELLPQIADGGCAPAPKPNKELKDALDEAGLGQPDRADLSILRRYAVITNYPFRGGCEICDLMQDCPRHKGEPGFASMVLPGYEMGRDE